VEARLVDELLFSGDILKCLITIKNTKKNEDGPLSAAWIALQVYGLLIVDPSWIILPQANNGSPQLHASQGIGSYLPKIENNKGRYIFSSPQILVACDIKLNPGEVKSFMCSCSLPEQLPPSFIGTAIRYSYYVTVMGKTDVRSPLSSTRFPFTVLNPESGITKKSLSEITLPNGIYNVTVQEVEFSSIISPNCIFERPKGREDRRWIELNHDDIPTPKKDGTVSKIRRFFSEPGKTVTTNINKGVHHICKFSTATTVYKLGDTITGHFDFSKGVLPCYQIVVTLVLLEEIESSVLHPHRKNMKKNIHPVDSFYEATHNALTTYFFF
jgi:hypothetical protein